MKFEFGTIVVLLLFVVGVWAYNTRKCDDKPSQTGPCKASFQMWRFIKERLKCESFTYGGCLSTKNIFELESDCKGQCLSSGSN
ncbi:trypsin inhibitor isoform X2 [Drosophila rhopaloa]|uniref:Trypsin inhibitor isoform X2 n=1 Tax=Drosophila rhopaloa TaxID=1041015 RepID=A0A6P4ES72_DRORH|nr:trypsin inhibitor isoform X2 [Drosophila rhopaloa]XP_016979540.1 trypsin inhibitor isoform X2 [Drosophila rhopaloa]